MVNVNVIASDKHSLRAILSYSEKLTDLIRLYITELRGQHT